MIKIKSLQIPGASYLTASPKYDIKWTCNETNYQYYVENVSYIMQKFHTYNSFFSSSTGGRALRSFSGISFSVVYVATPIGLL